MYLSKGNVGAELIQEANLVAAYGSYCLEVVNEGVHSEGNKTDGESLLGLLVELGSNSEVQVTEDLCTGVGGKILGGGSALKSKVSHHRRQVEGPLDIVNEFQVKNEILAADKVLSSGLGENVALESKGLRCEESSCYCKSDALVHISFLY